MKHRASRPSDPVGKDTLDRFSEAKNFNEWLFAQIKPWCSGDVLEVGSGIGNLSAFLIEQGFSTTLSDADEQYCTFLKSRFEGNPLFGGAYQIDLSAADFENRYGGFLGRFDAVIALNVIEHINDDKLAIANCKKLLKDGGKLIVLVPAFQQLYNSLDRQLNHFRRYNKAGLQKIHTANGFETLHLQYFNFAAIPGWWFSGKIMRSSVVPRHLLNLFNLMVPVIRYLDYLVFQRLGISVIHVGQKI